MRLIDSVPKMQALAGRWKRRNLPIVLVPTMGYLHEGHLSLIVAARRTARKAGQVVVSIYVNPTQFGPVEDFKRYPRDLERDLRICRKGGADVVFAPRSEEVYLPSFSTYVEETRLSRSMEGASRPTHFRGVTTIVAKLLMMTRADAAIFGAKDYQQAAIVKQMTRDLNFPTKIIVRPTVRDRDGLALSSRNKYLSPRQRDQAVALSRALRNCRIRVAASRVVKSSVLAQEVRAAIQGEPELRLDYVQFFDPETLEPVSRARAGTRMALAVFAGPTRLIDNASL